MKTIDRIKELVKPPDDSLSYLEKLPTIDIINEGIVACLITAIKTETDALKFCDLMENLVDVKSSQTDIELLRNGKLLT